MNTTFANVSDIAVSPTDALTDPAGVISQLLGEVQDLRLLVAETRELYRGQAAYAEDLERRITRLESGGF